MVDYLSFRQKLDVVLRTRDIKQVSDFLIAEGQWDAGTPADPAFAMWMMIATSPSLQDLQSQAREWMASNGHEEEAAAFLSKQKAVSSNKGRQSVPNSVGRRPVRPAAENRFRSDGSPHRGSGR